METEQRLIDVTEPLKLFRGWLKQLELPEDAGDKRGVESCIDILEDEPTVDAVEVVRCRDCKWWHDMKCTNINGANCLVMNENWFCCSGERKDNA